MAGPIQISILSNERGAVAGIDRVSDRGRKMGAALGKAGKVAALGLGAVAVAAVGAAGKLAQAAAEDEQSANRMAQTFTRAAGATRTQIAATEEWITAQGRAKGVADDELRPALSGLVVATKDVREAQKLAAIAMDVSAARGLSLESVSKTLVKVQNGSAAAAAKLGINTKTATGETISSEKAIKRLGEAYGGAAASNANTLMGRIDRLKLMFSEAGESLGAKMLPPLLDFSEWAIAKGVPVVERLASSLATNLAPPLRAVGQFASDVASRVRDLASGFDSGASVITPVVAALQTYADTAQNVVIPAVVAVGSYLASRLVPVFTDVGRIIATRVVPTVTALARFFYGTLVPAVVQIAGKVAGNLRPVFDQLVATFRGRVLPTVDKLLAKFEQYRPTIQRVVVVVVKVIGKVLEFASAILGKVLPPLIRLSGFLTGTVFSAISGTVSVVVKVIAKVVEFGAAAVRTAGKIAEFQAKVAGKIADVLRVIGELPGKVRGAVSGAITWLTQTGRDIIQGLLNGIDELIGQVTDKIAGLKDKVTGAVKGLGGALGGIVGRQSAGNPLLALTVGVDAGTAGLEKVLERTTALLDKTYNDRLKATLKRLRDNLRGEKLEKAIKAAQDASEKARKAATKSLAAETAALTLNAKAQDRVAASLAKARGRLDEARKAYAAYAAQVKAAVVGTGNVTNLGQNEDGTVSSTALVDQLRDKLVRAQRFAELIRQLTGKINATTLQQLIDAGVDGGLATAEAIAAGGKGAIAQINDLTAKLAATGESLGKSTADTFHGAGVTAAEGLVAGLESQAAKLDKAAQRLAARFRKALVKALGGKAGGQDAGREAALGRLDPLEVYVTHRNAAAAKSLHLTIEVAGEAQDGLARGKRYIADIDVALEGGARTKHIVVTRSKA